MPHVSFAKCSEIETSDFMYFHGLNTGLSGFQYFRVLWLRGQLTTEQEHSLLPRVYK